MTMAMLEKIKGRNHIMQYTVPVQNYIVEEYNKTAYRGMSARHYNPVQIGTYESIAVLDSEYDDSLGFRAKKLKKAYESPIFV